MARPLAGLSSTGSVDRHRPRIILVAITVGLRRVAVVRAWSACRVRIDAWERPAAATLTPRSAPMAQQ